ncbi:MAG: Gfo/Idh/MocA family oxidoreductase [Pirellulales bacterium]|nr:Gfo/Idh/MocA family oxidoreductase [Pirellulales bacterium]
MNRYPHLTRRRFLKSVGGVAFAAPFLVASSSRGAAESSPNERITLGFIGVGKQSYYHLSAMSARPDVQVLAICDVQETKRQAARQLVQERYGSAYPLGVYNDFRELLARDDIDAVVIGTPDHWHAIPAIEAAKAGKDIYCEKPLSLTVKEARAMVNAARRYGRVFQTGSQQRSDREFRFACEMVRSGRIGQLKSINVNVGGPSTDCYLPEEPVPEGVDWDLWLGPAPWRPYHSILCPPPSFTGYPLWRSYRDYSGGGMTDWGAHHFDIAQWGMGADDTGPVEIIPPDGKDVPLLTYKYANGVSVYHGGGGNGVVFHGAEGKIEVNRGHLETWPSNLKEKSIGPNEVHLYLSPGHHNDWLRAIRTRQKPICDVEIGARSVSVCHLGNLAYWLKRPLRWDPAKEEFVGDPEANRWLDRPRRDPWTLS